MRLIHSSTRRWTALAALAIAALSLAPSIADAQCRDSEIGRILQGTHAKMWWYKPLYCEIRNHWSVSMINSCTGRRWTRCEQQTVEKRWPVYGGTRECCLQTLYGCWGGGC